MDICAGRSARSPHDDGGIGVRGAASRSCFHAPARTRSGSVIRYCNRKPQRAAEGHQVALRLAPADGRRWPPVLARPRWARAAWVTDRPTGTRRAGRAGGHVVAHPRYLRPAASAAIAPAPAGSSPIGARLAGAIAAGSGNVWVRPSCRPGTGVPSRATKASSRRSRSGWRTGWPRLLLRTGSTPLARPGPGAGPPGGQHRVVAERGDPGAVVELDAE